MLDNTISSVNTSDYDRENAYDELVRFVYYDGDLWCDDDQTGVVLNATMTEFFNAWSC